MAENGNGKYLSWKWVVGLAIAIAGWLIVQGVGSINAQIERKVDKATYEAEKARDRQDIAEMKEMVRCIYNWHLPKDLRK